MLVTAMDINVTTNTLNTYIYILPTIIIIIITKKKNNAGNGDGYKRDT